MSLGERKFLAKTQYSDLTGTVAADIQNGLVRVFRDEGLISNSETILGFDITMDELSETSDRVFEVSALCIDTDMLPDIEPLISNESITVKMVTRLFSTIEFFGEVERFAMTLSSPELKLDGKVVRYLDG
ncbi:MAG: hypothetical protein ACPGVT_03880 [Maricaulaceae bacterium]